MKNQLTGTDAHLQVRNAERADIPAIRELVNRVYAGTGIEGYSRGALEGHQNHFPEGQFVITVNERLVAYCATFRVAEKVALSPHTWAGITANGFGSRHDPEGDWLYGMEVSVDPDYRGYRLGQRLYGERKKLCESLGLKGIAFGGRIPGLARRLKKFTTVENYLEQVQQKKARDPVLSFQLSNGFELIGLLKDYLPSDTASLGIAAHLVWRNPRVTPLEHVAPPRKNVTRAADTIRVGTVQYHQRRVNSFQEFTNMVDYFVDVMADYECDFVTFPELFTLQLLSLGDQELDSVAAIEALTELTPRFKEVMRDMSLRYNINIVAGSHPVRTGQGRIENIAHVFLRDGSVHEQTKIHPTPNEEYWWNIEGGDALNVIQTDCGPIGVLICYDSEFPELARYLTDQGMQILFVPFCTDERMGYLRVRYACQARAVENQIYVVMSGNVGNLPNVRNMNVQYAQSCILTPCDFMFSRDGVAADTSPNVETVAIADLRPDALTLARNKGTVRNLRDRRHDLYSLRWRGN